MAETSASLDPQAATSRQQKIRRQQRQLQRPRGVGSATSGASLSLSPPQSPSAAAAAAGRALRDEAAAALLERTTSGGEASITNALSRSVISITRGNDGDSAHGSGGGGGAATTDFERAASEGSLLGASSSAFASAWHALRIGAPDIGEAVEVGPMIGRGSYGRVYKGEKREREKEGESVFCLFLLFFDRSLSRDRSLTFFFFRKKYKI